MTPLDPSTALSGAYTDFDAWLRAKADLSVSYAEAATPDAEPVESVVTLDVDTSTEKYYRPNGERYLPRKMTVGGQVVDDVRFIQAAYRAKLPVLLYGPPGTGKTALLEAALPSLITLNGNIETEVADFVGGYVQRPNGLFEWVDGPLPIACERDNGCPLLVDEIALIDARVMSVGYSLMDGRDELVVTANPDRGIVKAKPGFMIFGAFNPGVPGAIVSDALLSRFAVHVEVGTDWKLADRLGVPPGLINIARSLNLKLREGGVTAAPQLRELLNFVKVEKTFGRDVALANFIGQCREEDRDAVKEQVRDVMGVTEPRPLQMG